MKRKIIPYNPKLKERARELRRTMTLAEVLLWKRLKGGQVLGCDFDRQRPLDEYIVDFYCKELCLAIEVDGKSHNNRHVQDAQRQRRLEELGVTVLRFWDHDVKTDMESVIDRIVGWIRAHPDEPARNPPRPSGTPPEEGML
jgi:very-short-patch-repair endonuclease